MAIVLMDGFDLYSNQTDLYSVYGGGGMTYSSTAGRFGGGAVTTSGANSTLRCVVDNQQPYVVMGAAIKVSGTYSSLPLMFASESTSTSATSTYLVLQTHSNGSLSVNDIVSEIRATSAPGIIVKDTWYYIELVWSRHTNGVARCFVNGVEVLTTPASNFFDGNDALYCFFGTTSLGTAGTASYDDIYIDQGTSVRSARGNVRIETLLPTADTAQADWTPLAGSGFSNIDDTNGSDGDTSYISTTTVGHKSLFEFQDLASSGAIKAVAVASRASRTDAGSATYRTVINSSSTEQTSASHVPAEGAYGLLRDIYETDPDTASDWTVSSVNALKAGVERDS